MYNSIIISKMQADKIFALRLEQALQGVKKQVLEQAKLLDMGVTRLSFYASCFASNYQDVCASQKQEDIRFMEALVQLLKHNDIIREMVAIYVDQFLKGVKEERIPKIQRLLSKMGADIASTSMSNQAFSSAITASVYYSVSMRLSIDSKLNKISAIAVTATGLYGHVQQAASAAQRLKMRNKPYYLALYSLKLEMLYFLIEPVISRNDHFFRPSMATDSEVASAIMGMIR
ncbi:hypothetical protein [Yersinia aldovae]|uniref:hypothetical protein n=1 Tax=Yersinia aldovae TaxID=29483 RepID=UPI0005AC3FEE|nr:hypothetical protein [Yersinia aldovae]AJJ63602.1 hypothetical protein AT01_1974 [Yersinia aldovae 670-83]